MKILSITIVRLREGADHVSLHTDVFEASHPFTNPLSLDFRAARGTAEDYVKTYFPGLPVTIVQTTDV